MGNNDTKLSTVNILNRSYDPGLDVLVVENINKDGVLINPATEDKQDPLSAYKQAGMDITSNPYYFGYLKTDGSWYIKKLDTTSGTTYVKGSSDYATSWVSHELLTYGEFNDIF